MSWAKLQALSILQDLGVKWVDLDTEREELLERAWNGCPVKDEEHLTRWFKQNLTQAERHLYLNNMVTEYAQRLLRTQLVPA